MVKTMNHDLFKNLFDRAYDSAMNDEDTIFGANKRIQELLVLEANKKEMEKVMWKTFPGYTKASTQCQPHVASWIFLNGINIICLKCLTRIDATEISLSKVTARQRRHRRRKPRWQRR